MPKCSEFIRVCSIKKNCKYFVSKEIGEIAYGRLIFGCNKNGRFVSDISKAKNNCKYFLRQALRRVRKI